MGEFQLEKSAVEMIIEGNVQGVGFRYYAQRKATLLDLTGYVLNMHNGKLKIKVEGIKEHVEIYIKEIEKGPPLSKIDNISITWKPYTGKFRNFSIRFAEFD